MTSIITHLDLENDLKTADILKVKPLVSLWTVWLISVWNDTALIRSYGIGRDGVHGAGVLIVKE